MRVTRVVTLASRTGRYGGPYDTALEQVRGLNESGVPAVVVAGTLPNDAPLQEVESTSTRQVFPLLPRMRFSALMSPALLRMIVREVDKSTIVHVSFCREAIPIAAAFIAIAMKRKLILQPHGMLQGGHGSGRRIFDTVIVKPILKRAQLVLALTEHEKAQLAADYGIEGQSIKLLGNPIRREFLAEPVAKGAPQSDALFIARLHARKNPMLFANAALHAQQDGCSTIYRIVGPDDGEQQHVRHAADSCINLECEDGIAPTLIPSYMRSCKVFVVCSTDEPWGNLLIGALASGKPVVVTRSCALATVIETAGAGVVVADNSSIELYMAVEMLIADRVFYDKCAENAVALSAEIASPVVLHEKLRSEIYQ